MTDGYEIYRLIYVSKSTMQGSRSEVEEEVNRILHVSRRNNVRDGITGALLFNDSCFAQVLEGAPDVIHEVFERIQLDPRHNDTVVLACEPARREFGHWSMAYAGFVPDNAAEFADLTEPGMADRASGQILQLLRGAILRQSAA